MRAPPPPAPDRPAPRRRAALRSHAVLMVTARVVFVCVLLLNGYVRSDFLGDQRIAPSTSNSQLPKQITRGGPIVDTRQQSPTSYEIPRNTVIISFDDGPDPTWTPRILEVLRKHGVPATFFVVGNRAVQHPGLVREIHESGSEIGVHTFSHPDLEYSPEWKRQFELSETQLAIAGAAGVSSSVFRPPYSSTSNAIDNKNWSVYLDAGRRGYLTLLSTHDPHDYLRPGVEKIVRVATPANGEGAVILMHDGGGDRTQTVAALDRLIPQLKSRGYTFTTVSGVLRAATNREVDRGQHTRGLVLLAVTKVATTTVDVLVVLFLVVGLLAIARWALMVVFAHRHAKRRHSPDWSWGPAVTRRASVIVPTYNEKECIADTVRSLVGGDHPVDVIVVDDGSTDGTADVVDDLHLPHVTVIRKPNGGKPSALNAGVARAGSDLIVMMDGDTVFESDTVRRLVQPFADPRVGAVAGNAKVANRGSLIGRWQHIEYVIGFNIDRRVYDVLQCMATVPGAVGAFRREALTDVGGVSDDTLAEDTDLTMAISRAGWRVVYEETARGWTEAPATLRQLWRQRYRWSYGTMQSLWKHRRAVLDRGPSGHFGRLGLLNVALFQVLLPLLAPLVDIMAIYGMLVLDPLPVLLAWLGLLSLQFAIGIYAFRLDHEPLGPVWLLPLQQFVYRQIMYAVIIQSVITAVSGVRLRWQKLKRSGGLQDLLDSETRRTQDQSGETRTT